MLRHFVFLEIIDSQEAVDSICKNLESLSLQMKGCFNFCFGKCVGEGAKHHYFFMDFLDESCRDHYINHPQHVRVAQEIIIPKLKDGFNSVHIFDYIQNNLTRMSQTKPGISGFVLVKTGEEISVLDEMAKHCESVNRLNPLQNCSAEPLGKEYAYALEVRLKENRQPIKFRQGLSFWIIPKSPESVVLERQVVLPLPSEGFIHSKL